MTLREVKGYLFVRNGRRVAWILAGCGVLLGVCMRLRVYSRFSYFPRDSILYLGQAKELLLDPASINRFSRPPLFQWLWSRLLLMGIPELRAGAFLVLGAGALLLFLIYPLCRELKLGRAASLLTLWLAAVNPWLVKCSVSPLREALYLFSAVAALYMLLLSCRSRMFYWTQCLGAFFFIMCVLSRIEGIQVLLLWIWSLWKHEQKSQSSAFVRIMDVAVFPIAAMLTLLAMCQMMHYDLLRIFSVGFHWVFRR